MKLGIYMLLYTFNTHAEYYKIKLNRWRILSAWDCIGGGATFYWRAL